MRSKGFESVAGAVGNAAKFSIAEKKRLTDRLGDISTINPLQNRVWVALWVRPDAKDLGNGKKILLTDSTKDEDVYQGNVALVVKLGPTAFKSDAMVSFEGSEVAVGDWVMFNRHAAGHRFTHRGVHCVMLEGEQPIKALLTRPDLVE